MPTVKAPYSILKHSCHLAGGLLAFDAEHNAIKYAVFVLSKYKDSFGEQKLYLSTIENDNEKHFVVSTVIPCLLKQVDCYVVEEVTLEQTENDDLLFVRRHWCKAKEACEMTLDSSRYYVVTDTRATSAIDALREPPIDSGRVGEILRPFVAHLDLDKIAHGPIFSSRVFNEKVLIAVPLSEYTPTLTYQWRQNEIRNT